MIPVQEFRIGNLLLQKVMGKIKTVACTAAHFGIATGPDANSLYPVVLKPELLERCGFAENIDYPLRPQAREFRLVLPVIGSGSNEILGYVKNNGECFARAMVNGAVVSNNVHHMHQLQNLYHALTGAELAVRP